MRRLSDLGTRISLMDERGEIAAVQSALDADGNDNVTAIVLDLRDDSANNAADTATNTTVDIDWNVSKIGDYEVIGDLQEGTLQTLRTIQ